MPTLVVFDLDYTLWDAGGTWCDQLAPPFSCQQGRVVDRDGSHVRLYSDVKRILNWCDNHGLSMALASRTYEPAWAKRLLDLHGIRDRFVYEEIYPSSKDCHFKALQKQTGLPYDQMLFFDDEPRNIREVGQLGVTAVHVREGVTWDVFVSAKGQSGMSPQSHEGTKKG
jgi:magnesium-dependent phosphatase 1